MFPTTTQTIAFQGEASFYEQLSTCLHQRSYQHVNIRSRVLLLLHSDRGALNTKSAACWIHSIYLIIIQLNFIQSLIQSINHAFLHYTIYGPINSPRRKRACSTVLSCPCGVEERLREEGSGYEEEQSTGADILRRGGGAQRCARPPQKYNIAN